MSFILILSLCRGKEQQRNVGNLGIEMISMKITRLSFILYRRQILGFYVPLHNKVSIDPLRFRVLNLCAPIKRFKATHILARFLPGSVLRNIRFSTNTVRFAAVKLA